MTTADAYAALDHANAARRAAEIGEVLAIARIIDLYEVDTDDVMAAGVEQLIDPGNDGTPLIGEFLALEIGARLGLSPSTAVAWLGEVLDVRHRHPRLWEAFLEGKVWWWQASRLAHECRELSYEDALKIDVRVTHAMVLWPWTRVMWHLPKWITIVDPEPARRRERAAREDRFLNVRSLEDGHAWVEGRLSAEDGVAFDHTITQLAATLPEPELPEGTEEGTERATRYRYNARRAAAAGELARAAAGQDVLPTHELVVHIPVDDPALTGIGDATGMAEIEGKWGHILTERLPEFLKDSKVVVRPVLDPNGLDAVEGYAPPTLMRLAMQVRNPVEVFPFGTRKSRGCDLDHTVPYVPGRRAQTSMANLGPLSRRTHRAKTHGGWQLSQPMPGVFHWRSPVGYEYLVTAHGTVELKVPERRPPCGSSDPPPEIVDPPPEHEAWDQLPTHPPTLTLTA